MAYLFFDRAVHALEHPHDPAALDDLADESKCPRLGRGYIHFFLLHTHGEEVLEKPFCDEQQPEVILLCDLWALRLDVLEQGREESYVGNKHDVIVAPHSPPPARLSCPLSGRQGGGEKKKKGGGKEIRTIKAGFDERAREPAQDRCRLGRQVIPARYLVLLLPPLLELALGEIDHGSSCGLLAERLLSMQNEWLGRGVVGCNRVPRLALGSRATRRGHLLWVQSHRDRGPETRVT